MKWFCGGYCTKGAGPCPGHDLKPGDYEEALKKNEELLQQCVDQRAALEGLMRAMDKEGSPLPENDTVHRMQDCARAVAMILPETVRFFIFAGDIGEGADRRGNYVSNMERKTALETMKEFLERMDDKPESFGKHTL